MLRGPVQGLETGFWEFGAVAGDSQGGNKEPPLCNHKELDSANNLQECEVRFLPQRVQ